MKFQKKLDHIMEKNNSLLCVGLDSDYEKIPSKFKKERNPQFAFNYWIIKQTADLVCAYKPNSAFYEARGAQGMRELKMTCSYLRKKHPQKEGLFLVKDLDKKPKN